MMMIKGYLITRCMALTGKRNTTITGSLLKRKKDTWNKLTWHWMMTSKHTKDYIRLNRQDSFLICQAASEKIIQSRSTMILPRRGNSGPIYPALKGKNLSVIISAHLAG